MFKAFVSTFLLLAMQLTSATGFSVLLDDAGVNTQWWHFLIGFMAFNTALWAFLHLNDASISITDNFCDYKETSND